MAVIIKGKNANKPYTVRWYTDGGRRPHEKSFRLAADARTFKASIELQPVYTTADSQTTLAQFFATWIAQHAVSPGTKRTYQSVFANQIKPALGSTPLARVTREDVRALLLEKMPQSVGPDMVKTARTLLTALLGEAVQQGKIPSNPASRIRLPAAGSKRAEFHMATHEELDTLARALLPRHRMAVWLMRGCGLRIGEALAVRADSVRGGVLRVEEQALQDGSRGPLKGRKPGEYRDVPLPGYVAREIAAHCREFGLGGGDYLFGQVRSDVVRAQFTRAARAAGLPSEFTPHDLRHIYASVCLHEGIPLSEVARFLGHRDAAITQQVYGHLVPNALSRAVGVLDAEYAAWSSAA